MIPIPTLPDNPNDNEWAKPYRALIAAWLQRKVLDAGSDLAGTARFPTDERRAIRDDARAFFADKEAVSWWLTLFGADPEGVLPALLAHAGMPHQRDASGAVVPCGTPKPRLRTRRTDPLV